MALPNNLTSFSTALTKLPQQRIAQALSALLLVYIAFLAAKITWLAAPQAPLVSSGVSATYTSPKAQGSQSFAIAPLQALNLFGKLEEKTTQVVVEQITSAPETRLQLTLSGLVASDDVEIAAAVIENKKQQATYGIGDIIKGTRASLEQVLIDRVIIKQSGRLETLMLDGADYNQAPQSVSTKKISAEQARKNAQAIAKNTGPNASSSTKSTVDQRANAELSRNAKQLRADLQNNPGKITDYLRISPARKAGELVGYRLSPGKDPAFFTLSGLKSGDIATQMNGYNLLSPLEAAQAMSALKTERNISLLVERNNTIIEILFSIE